MSIWFLLGQLTWIGDEVLAGISTRNFRRRLGIVLMNLALALTSIP